MGDSPGSDLDIDEVSFDLDIGSAEVFGVYEVGSKILVRYGRSGNKAESDVTAYDSTGARLWTSYGSVSIPLIEYASSELVIGESRVDLGENEIRDVYEVGDAILLVYDDLPDGDRDSNLDGFDSAGNYLWTVHSDEKDQMYVTSVKPNSERFDGQLIIDTYHGSHYTLDLETGEREYVGWSR